MDREPVFSVQHWLRSAPQGYLLGTEYGHLPGEEEPPELLEDPDLCRQAVALTVQLVVAERCALAASSGLIAAAPEPESRLFLATQTADEARHAEMFARRLLDLGVEEEELEQTIEELASPHLVRFGEQLLERVDRGDFAAGLVGQNLIFEGMAMHVFDLLRAAHEGVNPKFARSLEGALADEQRHASFGEDRLRVQIRREAKRVGEIERLQRELAESILAIFDDLFRQEPIPGRELAALHGRHLRRAGGVAAPPPSWRGHELARLKPEELEDLLADAVFAELEARLGRAGLSFETPERPRGA